MFIGVRDLFNKAQMNSPCLVFIDEIDAVGMQRGTGIGGGKDEREQTLNQVWTEMDGFSGNSGVIVIAAVGVKLEGLPAEGVGRCKLSSSGRENPCTRSHGQNRLEEAIPVCVLMPHERKREESDSERACVFCPSMCVALWSCMVTEREVMNAWFDQASHGWRGVRLKPAERREKGSWVLPQFQHKLLSSSSVCVSMDGCYGGAGG
ncbi:uncharacterized protein LOC114282028 [Camellia sinensis]|uniref:uncharacterized protein LOC114282028 n=1 Tax=Camellia sinensis TaxID=4442 RepID=UPI001036B6A0|nr:uncharacterized protein LOC114282028 [Camellia sinensis]